MYGQRAYSRGYHFGTEARMSRDGENWFPADVSNISSGGLKFHTADEYAEGDVLWFHIRLAGFLTEFEVKSLAQVRHKTLHDGIFHYGAAFRGLSADKKVQIDENVRADRPVAGKDYGAG